MKAPKIRKIEFRDSLYRRRYLVPNAVTLANMFCGFLTIIYASSGRFEKAALAIGIAILLDGLDGRVARRLNATSKFGLEFDSFSDLVSFGVAPGVLIYQWLFKIPADEFGVAITFVYVLCAASRLARFNISAENLNSFTGLPTPGAAAMIAATVNAFPRLGESVIDVSFGTVALYTGLGAAAMLFLSYLMVSHLDFFSIKRIKIKTMHLPARIAIGSLIALIWYNNHIGFFVLAFGYCMSGPMALLVKNRGKAEGKQDSQVA